MRGLVLTLAGAFVACASAQATTYEVGPGHPHDAIGDVPWEALAAGDSVLIHARPQPYKEKWVICRAGTQSAPIVVRGVADGSGALPVVDGNGATTRSQLNFWNENRGVIKIGGANNPPDTMPAWIVIENLEVKSARPEYTFTGREGVTAYANNAASIYIEKGQHIVVRGCHLHDCSNGFFCAYLASDLTVEGNWLEDNGNVGSIYEHNSYTEALGIVFQGNRMGPMRAGSSGNNLKDRSAGTVIRYNWIEGGNRQLDLVDSDYDALIDDPRYRETFVYGNVLVEHAADGNSQIVHYGGDSGILGQYRQGTLYFHHNTVLSERTGNTTLMRLSSDGESADVRNDIVFVSNAPGSRLGLLDEDGTLEATQNWFKTGWVPSHSGAAVDVVDNGQVTGNDPGFTDLGAYEFTLDASSPCVDAGAPLPQAVIPDHVPILEYVKHQMTRPRGADAMPDIGAYEQSSALDTASESATPSIRPMRALPNPFRARVRIDIATGAPAPRTLVITDLAGRRVAVLPADERGGWFWEPSSSLPPGIYVASAGAQSRKLLFLK